MMGTFNNIEKELRLETLNINVKTMLNEYILNEWKELNI